MSSYVCMELIAKAEACVVAEFSPCSEYLAVGCSTGKILIYSFLTHSVIIRY